MTRSLQDSHCTLQIPRFHKHIIRIKRGDREDANSRLSQRLRDSREDSNQIQRQGPAHSQRPIVALALDLYRDDMLDRSDLSSS